jgi:DNA-binding SARP family transcriptional activator
MEFLILGPLEVRDNGEPVAVGGGKQRVLLALLILRPNEVVSSDRLIDELWHGEPPETARKALQVHVSNLRKALGEDRIVTQAPGYRLRLEPGELDLERFEALRSDGNLREALDLWRGAPLADFADEPFAQAERARLEELRLAAIVQRIEADLALGRHADLVPELERLVADEPLRERLRAQLMLALYRCGRQADALESYQAARRALVDELGIEPGRALQELEQAILRQEPSLDWIPPLKAPVAPEPETVPSRSAGVFVGRERELARCQEALDQARAGTGRLLLISGEPGIGKSRLSEELAGRAAALGAAVLVGRCWEAGGAPPYWPWAQALRSYARRCDPRALREQLGPGAADVANVVPDIRAVLTDLPDSTPSESEGARFRLFESVAGFLERASRAQPLLVCLDDLHAADAPSLLLLQFVAAELERTRMLIVGAYRDVDPTVSDQLSAMLAAVSRREVTHRIALGGLSEPEVNRYIELSGGTNASARLSVALHAETEGNPLFVGEIVRLLAAEGRLEEPGPRIAVPDTVREVIGRRFGRLSSECRRVLTLASVLGREFGLVALERVADYTGIDKLLEVLDEAIEARVLGEVPGAIGRLRFAHALIRDTLYREVPATQRVRLHRRVAEVLEELYATDLEPHLAELAHHYLAAVPAVELDIAVDYARRAGDRAGTLLAYEEAARLYELALQALNVDGSDQGARCELLLALGEVRARAGDELAAKQAFLAAADLARGATESAHLARAALGYGGRIVWSRAGGDQLVPLLQDALGQLDEGDSALRAKLLARLAGGALRGRASTEKREGLSAEAVEIAERLDDPAALAYALDARIAVLQTPNDPARRLPIAAELVRVAQLAGDKERAFQGHIYRYVALLQLGDVQTADAELDAAGALARELQQPTQLWQLHANHALRALDDGRLDDAEASIGRALEYGERAQAGDSVLTSHIHLYALRRHQDRLPEFADAIEGAVRDYPARPILRSLLASVAAETGAEARARAAFQSLAEERFAALPVDDEWLFSASILAEVCAALDDADRAAVLYELLLPFSEQNAVTPPEGGAGSVSRYLALLAWTMRAYGTAAGHFEAALAANAAMRARPWLAYTREDFGRMLLEGGGDEQRRGLELLAAAREAYLGAGMASRAEEASRQLETHDVGTSKPQSGTRGEALARAALGYGGRLVWSRAGRDHMLVPLLEEALDALSDEDTALRARVLARLAGALRDQPDRARRVALSGEAVEIARRLGDPATLAYVLDGRLSAIQLPENTRERLEIATEILSLAEESGDKEQQFQGHDHRLMALVELGDLEAAAAAGAAQARIARELRQPAQLWLVEVNKAMWALLAGRFDEAEALIPKAYAVGAGAQARDATFCYRIQLYALRRERGGAEELEPVVLQSVEEYPDYPSFRCALAQLYAEAGRSYEARREFELLAEDDFAGLHRDIEWLFGMSFLPEVAAYLGDTARSALLYDSLLPFARRVASSPPDVCTGAVSRYLGILAATMSRWDDAERHYVEALAIHERMRARPWLAHTQHDFGRMLLARNGPGDHQRAGALLAAAVATYSELEMDTWAEKAAAENGPSAKAPTPSSGQLARAALGYGGLIAWERPGADERVIPLLEEALEALPAQDDVLRSRLLARLAGALRDEHSRERRDTLSGEAVELARRSDDLAALAYALDGRAAAIIAPDTVAECLALGRELCEVAARSGDTERVVAGYAWRIMAQLCLGDIHAAEGDLAAASRTAELLGQPARMWEVAGVRAMLALAAGRLDEAEQLVPQALALGERALPEGAIPVYRLQWYTLCDFRRSLDEVEPGIRELIADYPARRVFRCALAHLEARLGRTPAAASMVDELVGDNCSALPFDQEWLFGMSLLAEASALVGDGRSAAVLYESFAPWGALNAVDQGEGIRGSVSRYLGLLATTLERWSNAAEHFEDALVMNERMGARPWLAHTRHDFARMLLRREGSGDAERAATLLSDAIAVYRELGMAPWIARAEALRAG